jgi:hypothetical protein
MRNRRVYIVGFTYLAATVSGLTKQLELPELVVKFEQSGIPPEALSLLGAGEFVLALALLFPRTRPSAGLIMAALFGFCAFSLWPMGISLLWAFSALMVPASLLAGFWRGGFYTRPEPYLGAMPLGVSKPRR